MAKRKQKADSKKTSKKTNKKPTPKNDKPIKKRNKQPEKLSTKNKISLPSKGNTRRKDVSTTGNRPVKSRTKPDSLRVPRQKRGAKQVEFNFSGVKSADKKIQSFQEHSGKTLKKELKKRGGKPPRGAIIIVNDKDGNEKTFVTPLDFVVNETNVKNFIEEKLNEMKDNFAMWSKMKKVDKDFAKEMKEQGYGDYNPDSIAGITIKWII